jgi:hypothetical protein
MFQCNGESLSEVVVQTNFGYFSKDSRLLSSFLSTIARTISLKYRDLMKTGSSFRYSSVGHGITGGSAQAIYVVDGCFVDGSEASALSSNDIESVSVLKDGASAAIYGCVEEWSYYY